MTPTIGGGMPAKKEPQTGFGRRLVAARRARRMTQIELARAMGTTQRAISYYETQVEFPPGEALASLARALHVSADQLLGLAPAPPLAPRAAPAESRLWKRFRRMAQLPERDQRAVLRLIVSLSGQRKTA